VSLMYENPFFYNLFLKILHGTSLRKRYEIIAQEIGENKRVFEPGCGTCFVYPYLQDGCEYVGWDLNPHFIRYNIKRKRSVYLKNIFDFDEYPPNDVIILCDILHHVVPRHEELIKGILGKTKKLIVSEPKASFTVQRKFKRAASFLHRTFFEDDGINPIDEMIEWDYPEEKLHALFTQCGCTNIIDGGFNSIAVFDRKEKVT
jgi:SAM-dependent methyltransferase